ncbi:MAG: DUF4870 domain-containing protein [Pseudolysinimonas sp.]|uniref:DUF4870 domain-containing protein n=1 Tax=Pseudolysinimonas sp. TaxID=2680009 RepID=UPI0032636499
MSTPPPPPAQPAAPQPAIPAQPAGPLTEAGDKQWAMLAHFGGAISLFTIFVGFSLVSFIGGVPGSVIVQVILALLSLVPALVIYLVFGKRGPRTLVESKEALNFQITAVAILVVWIIVSSIIVYNIIVSLAFGFSEGPYWAIFIVLGIPTLAIVGLNILLSVLGGLKVQKGGTYRYPFAIRVIK